MLRSDMSLIHNRTTFTLSKQQREERKMETIRNDRQNSIRDKPTG